MTIDQRVIVAKENLEKKKSYQSVQETLKLVNEFQQLGLIKPPKFTLALHGEVRITT
ncbi:hypothetical protein [Acinetobacter sp.]|uniref:hypothetical protein n=1 Tax=Acinetobacter sp. TaxID=472 RepID=UPI0035B3854C